MKTKRLWLTSIATLLLLLVYMGSCKDEDVEVVGVCPIVATTNPANLQVNVPLNQVITAVFNVPMNPESISQATFSIEGNSPKGMQADGITIDDVEKIDLTKTKSTGDPVAINVKISSSTAATPIVGTVTYSGLTATFTPSNALQAGTIYTGTISRSVKDLNGNHLVTDYVWTFTTGSAIAPAVIATDPMNLGTSVALDKTISADFSMAMNASTITTSSFTLMDGTTPIAGVVNYSGTTATFDPTSNLLLGKTYTATITTAVTNTLSTPIGANYVWTFSTNALVAPTVILVDPLNLATNIALDKVISANFSVAMDPLTINTSSFTLMDGLTPVTGIVNYSGTTATFTPSSNLLPGKTYTGTITTVAKNVDGTAIANNYVWSFTTVPPIPPTVTLTDPLNSATNVALNKVISATFSVAMDPLTITTSSFTIKDGVTPVTGVVNYSGTTATFTPSSDLLPGKTYTGTITTDAKNVDGTAIANNHVWTFNTVAPVAPTVTLTDPLNSATNVALNKVISATFSVAMDPLTITTSSFTVKDGVTPVTGVVNYSGSTATFTPSSDLVAGTTYTGTITTDAKNIAGTAIANNHTWTFTTVDPVAPVVLTTDPLNAATNVPLNKVISADFSEAMNSLTITTATFTLTEGIKSASINLNNTSRTKSIAPNRNLISSKSSSNKGVIGIVNYSGNTATFTPSSDLLPGKTYTAEMTTGIENVSGTPLSNNYQWQFTTVAPVAPTVTLTDPLNLATNVALNKVISATFSVAMDPLTITTSTFTLKDGLVSIPGLVSYLGSTATFTPSSNLPAGKTLTATITTGAKNEAGTALANDYVWTFSTNAALPPTVISTDPLDADIDVLFNKVISATFSVAMDPLTITTLTFTLKDGLVSIPGVVDYLGSTATFTPSSNLPAGKTFTATITTGAKNEAGTALANDYVWNFTTQLSLTVIAVNGTVVKNPNQTAYNNGDNVILTATANNGYTFDSWSGDASGTDNPLTVLMNSNKTITAVFTENPPVGPGEVNLGSSGDFAILTKSGIDWIGTGLITGHIGVTPIGQTAITGFSQSMDPSGEFSTSIYVSGRIYAADYADPTPSYVGTAMLDQEAAFTAAMGLTTDVITELGSGIISGMTLAPALYKWGTGLLVSNVGVTLSGGPKDTWVFQVSDDITIQDGAIITLTGGALAKNVFWVTEKQALLGSGVIFKGNIIAKTLISLNSGTTVDGRLLCQTAVTLISSSVTKPTSK